MDREVNAAGPSGKGRAPRAVGGGPFSSRWSSEHTLQCPSQILNPDPPHPALGSQDPLIPVGFLAMDEGVGGYEGGWIRGRKAEPDTRQGQGQRLSVSPCHLSPSMQKH